MSLSGSKREIRGWSWRGLLLAGLLAVSAHLALFWVTHTQWPIQTFAHQASALSIRLVPEVMQQVAAQQDQAPPKQKSVARSVAALKPHGEQIVPERGHAEKNIESTTPAHEKSAHIAVNLIANSHQAPFNLNADAPAAPRLLTASMAHQRAYPLSVALQMDAKLMSQGQLQTGAAMLTWSIDGSAYELSLHVQAMLLFHRVEKSVGLLTSTGIAPRRYSSSRSGRSEQATHFRPELGRIQFSANKPDEAWLSGAQDRLSVLMELAALLAGRSQGYERGERIQIQVATLDNAQIWEFMVQGRSSLNFPTGEVEVIELIRKQRHEYDPRLQIWFAPELGFLPVRILQSSRTAPAQEFTDLKLSKLP